MEITTQPHLARPHGSHTAVNQMTQFGVSLTLFINALGGAISLRLAADFLYLMFSDCNRKMDEEFNVCIKASCTGMLISDTLTIALWYVTRGTYIYDGCVWPMSHDECYRRYQGQKLQKSIRRRGRPRGERASLWSLWNRSYRSVQRWAGIPGIRVWDMLLLPQLTPACPPWFKRLISACSPFCSFFFYLLCDFDLHHPVCYWRKNETFVGYYTCESFKSTMSKFFLQYNKAIRNMWSWHNRFCTACDACQPLS